MINNEASKNKLPHKKFYIYEALYEWYTQQNLSLDHLSKKRSHFCILVFIQLYIENRFDLHSNNKDAVAISDNFKNILKCNSNSFNSIFDIYFEKLIDGNHTYCSPFYSNGYKLKDIYLHQIYNLIEKDFVKNNSLSYVIIEENEYYHTTLYNTPNNLWVKNKFFALKQNNISRRNEEKLLKKEATILKSFKIKDKQMLEFHIPKGYFKYPLIINSIYLKNLILKKEVNYLDKMFYMRLLTINSIYPYAVYKQLDTGRLQTISNINNNYYIVLMNYQGIKKTYRKNIFKEMYEYDISTSAPTILLQLYKKHFPADDPLNSINNYIKNKKECREYWASLIKEDNSVKKVKSILTALFFGANIKFYRSNKIKSIMTDENFRILLSNKDFSSLVDDVKKLFSSLTRKYCHRRKNLNNYVVKNMAGINRKFNLSEKNRAIAHIYQGIEITILKAIQEKYADSICLMIHDAIITRDKLDTSELSRLAFEATEYEVIFEEDRLC